MKIHLRPEVRLMRSLSDRDLDRLAALRQVPGRFAVADIYDINHGLRRVLCGPGTEYPNWLDLDVHTVLAIGDWRPGHPAFDKMMSLFRYEDAVHAGTHDRHGVHLMRLGERAEVAELAEAEIIRRESEREAWEGGAAAA